MTTTSDDDILGPHASFAVQQEAALDWAARVLLSAEDAERITAGLAVTFHFRHPHLFWEQAGLVGEARWAATTRNERTEGMTITFATHGCSLWVLCHELVHCWRRWEDPHHDDVDWDLAVIFTEECRDLV